MKFFNIVFSFFAVGVLSGTPSIVFAQETEKVITYTEDELRKARPATGFKLVYAEDESVCNEVLSALNEPGYDTRYFNHSEEFENLLPELLIQTRLNVPRTLIGTHLYRTEEYELVFNENGQEKKEYWYRFIGQETSRFGYATGVKQPWFSTQNQPFIDFMDFIDNGLPYPDCYYDKKNKCYGTRFMNITSYKNLWEIEKNEVYDQKNNILKLNEFNYKSPLVIEVISVRHKYYLLSIEYHLKNNKEILLALTDYDENFSSVRYAQCFFESIYKVIKNDN